MPLVSVRPAPQKRWISSGASKTGDVRSDAPPAAIPGCGGSPGRSEAPDDRHPEARFDEKAKVTPDRKSRAEASKTEFLQAHHLDATSGPSHSSNPTRSFLI